GLEGRDHALSEKTKRLPVRSPFVQPLRLEISPSREHFLPQHNPTGRQLRASAVHEAHLALTAWRHRRSMAPPAIERPLILLLNRRVPPNLRLPPCHVCNFREAHSELLFLESLRLWEHQSMRRPIQRW